MSNKLSKEAAEARRAYQREWYRKNKDKVKAAQERYWGKKAKQLQQAADHSTDTAMQQ
jgi:hypothetical protein